MNIHWPNQYRGRRDGVWVLKMPDGTFQTFHIRIYGGNRTEDDPIMRISDDYRPQRGDKHRVYFKESAGSGIGEGRIELNFLASESKEVFAWFFDNYVMVKEWPGFMSEKRMYSFPKVGDPLSGYLWTDRAEKEMDAGMQRQNQMKQWRLEGQNGTASAMDDSSKAMT